MPHRTRFHGFPPWVLLARQLPRQPARYGKLLSNASTGLQGALEALFVMICCVLGMLAMWIMWLLAASARRGLFRGLSDFSRMHPDPAARSNGRPVLYQLHRRVVLADRLGDRELGDRRVTEPGP